MNLYFRQLGFVILVSLLLPQRSEAQVGNNNPTGVAGEYSGSVTTGGSYDPYTGNASRVVEDIVVAGAVGAYPLKWTRFMNTRGMPINDLGQGGGWSHSYDWSLWFHPEPTGTPPPGGTVYEGPDVKITYPDGRKGEISDFWETGRGRANVNGQFGGDDRLVDINNQHQNYDLLLADGGVVKFIGSRAHEIIDPYGRSTILGRDTTGRLNTITEPEPGGRYLQINYASHSGQFGTVSFIDSVQAFDGRGNLTQTVTYSYTEKTFNQNYRFFYLTGVHYDDQTSATYTYRASNKRQIGNGLVETCDDVRFAGPMKKIKYEYEFEPEPTPARSRVASGQISRETNVNGQLLSQVSYPSSPSDTHRTETRPDGSTRSFEYYDGAFGIHRYSDFSNPPHWSKHAAIIPGPPWDDVVRWELTDARENITYREGEPVIGAVRLVRHPDLSTIVTQYSDSAAPYYVEFRTDENQKTTHYMRDDNHRVRRIEHPDYPANGYEEFTYNNFDQILTHTMTSGGIEHFEYDNRGLKTLFWPPSTSDLTPVNNPTQYFYYGGSSGPGNAPEVARLDLIDRLRRVIDPRGNSTWYEYNIRGQVTRVTHQDGNYTQSDYNTDGTLAWTEDELRHRTTYTYDDYKRVTETINHLNETVTNSYAPWNGFSPLSHTSSSVYRVTSQMQKKTDYDYDNNFRRTRTTQAPDTPNDAATTTYTYNEVGNLQTVTEPNGQPGQSHPGAHTTFGYNNRNRQTTVTNNTPPETTTVLYDFVGNKKSETRHDGTFRSWNYDAMNRLWHAYDWRTNVTPTANQTTTYDRDHAGNATFITDTKGAVYSFVYDALNRKESATNPSDNTIPARTESWHYDIAGNLDGYTNPDQKHRHFRYDNRNRQDRSWWDGGVAIGQDIWTGYDAASRVTSIVTKNVETPITTVAFGYDAANRKLWEDQTLAGQQPGVPTKTRRVKTELDPDGKRLNLDLVDPPQEGGELIFSEEMSGSGRYTLTYEYTQRNQLRTISGGAEEQWAFNYLYDRSGNMTTREAQYHGGTSSTNCPSQNYDELNRPTTWEQTGPNGFHALSHYQYDQVNRESATWREEEDNRGERFTYEPTNQLATAAYNGHVANGPPADATRTVTYAYTPDKLNRSSMTDTANSVSGGLTDYSPNALNQYRDTPGHYYSYDNNFNLTHVAGFNGVYDAANRLVSASNGGSGEAQTTVAGFVYDGLGRCVKRTFNNVATVFLYDGWKPIAEFDAWNEFHAWNVYGPGPDEILLRQHVKYGYVRFHLDRHGNVAFLVDNDGWIKEKYVYDAFGQPTVTTLTGQNARSWSYYGHDFLFQGREYIRELGIYDYRNRFYLPATGRFLQTDPTGFGAGDMNLFRYCSDEPVTGSDPTGLSDVSYIPTWDSSTKRDVDQREILVNTIVASAHGAPTYAANSNVTRHALGMSRLGRAEIPESMRLTVDQLVKDIKKLAKYTPTMPIKLEMCHAGDVKGAALKGDISLAQKVANAFRTNPIWANPGDVDPATGKGKTDAYIRFTASESASPTAPTKNPAASSGNNNSLGIGNHRPFSGLGSSLVSTGGGDWDTAGYSPGGGEEGEGFHPVTPDKN